MWGEYNKRENSVLFLQAYTVALLGISAILPVRKRELKIWLFCFYNYTMKEDLDSSASTQKWFVLPYKSSSWDLSSMKRKEKKTFCLQNSLDHSPKFMSFCFKVVEQSHNSGFKRLSFWLGSNGRVPRIEHIHLHSMTDLYSLSYCNLKCLWNVAPDGYTFSRNKLWGKSGPE